MSCAVKNKTAPPEPENLAGAPCGELDHGNVVGAEARVAGHGPPDSRRAAAESSRAWRRLKKVDGPTQTLSISIH